jgi:hypothetical protein
MSCGSERQRETQHGREGQMAMHFDTTTSPAGTSCDHDRGEHG